MSGRLTPFAELGGTRSQSRDLPLAVVIISRDISSSVALRSVEASLGDFPHALMVVDASHSDDAISLVREFPSVRYIVPAKPISYTAAALLGMEESSARFVLIMPGDASVTSLSLSEIDTGGTACAVIAPVLSHQGRKARSVMNGYITEDETIAFEYSEPADIDISLSAYRGIGLFDRGLYQEIGGFHQFRSAAYTFLDYCYRALALGRPTVVHRACSMDVPDGEEPISDELDDAYFHYRNALFPRYDKPASRIPAGIFSRARTAALLPRIRSIQEQRAWRHAHPRKDDEMLLYVRTNILT